jgi:hypothetical protein
VFDRRHSFAKTTLALSATCLALALSAGTARAETSCKSVADAAARLHCYDKLEAQGLLEAASVSAPESAPATAPVASADPANFGIAPVKLASDPLNEAAAKKENVERDDDGDVEALTSRILDYSMTGDRMVMVVLANGQVWRQVSGRQLFLKDGDDAENTARISRTVLGGFSMTVNGRNDVAIVKRVDKKRR